MGNGARRGLALLAVLGQAALHDGSWKTMRVIERREFLRALAWVEWNRTHNRKGVELDLPPWPAKRLGRRQQAKLEQIPIPFECQDAERAV
jgi:hypothetical protein